MVPGDFWIVPMGIEGYRRFLSVKCPNGATALFGEREPNVCQRIFNVAAEQGIRLDEGFIVWVVQGDMVTRSGDNEQLVFDDQSAAIAFAEKHRSEVRVFVTGPVNSQCMEILARRETH